MSEGSVLGQQARELYKILCQDKWNPYITATIIAFLSVVIAAWYSSWGATGAVQNWGDWIWYGVGVGDSAPSNILMHSGSVIGIGFIAGAFVSACLGNNFAFRIPPKLELVKAVVAGALMGIGAILGGGCNVGGFFNALGNLSAHGITMWIGLIIGAILALKYTYWEMENISWGQGGAKTFEIPAAVQVVLGIIALLALIIGAYAYAGSQEQFWGHKGWSPLGTLGGVLLLAAALGYTFQRGRWCMIQAFREPHMTGDCKMAKSVALAIALLALGIMVLKANGIVAPEHYLRGVFGWGGVLGGIIFGFGAVIAGGCGTGTLWRVGEGQIKLWIVTIFFGMGASLTSKFIHGPRDIEGIMAWYQAGNPLPFHEGSLGSFVYLPFTFLGYGGTLALLWGLMAAWWLAVTWNEKTQKGVLEM
ncbi:MAG: YeeE/YedE thiosulfate transporter family protein [Desulfurivibrio sp.]|nr:YeeE/YedE thiosulfate transporter family protein [Desulfurivibrio sp.]